MADSFTEVSSQGWLSRIGDSIKGVLVGFILFAVAFPLLFWNEGRAVTTAKTLDEGAGAVVSVAPDAVAPGNEGKLVHVSGQATTTETLTDPECGVSLVALRLERDVEMFQWKESKDTKTEKKLGGGEERRTTYTYTKEWDDDAIDSGQFKDRAGHENPTTWPLRSAQFAAGAVTLGAFQLSASLIGQIDAAETVAPSAAPASIGGRAAKATQGGLYLGADPASPQVGDVKVTFRVARPGVLSLVSRQRGSSFEPYVASTGQSIEMLHMGSASAAQMFQEAKDANTALTWILRAVGFILMFVGLSAIFKPLSVVADVVPLIGGIIGLGTAAAAFGLALVFSTLTVGVAWIFYRPLIGVPLVAVGVVVLALLFVRGRAARPTGA